MPVVPSWKKRPADVIGNSVHVRRFAWAPMASPEERRIGRAKADVLPQGAGLSA